MVSIHPCRLGQKLSSLETTFSQECSRIAFLPTKVDGKFCQPLADKGGKWHLDIHSWEFCPLYRRQRCYSGHSICGRQATSSRRVSYMTAMFCWNTLSCSSAWGTQGPTASSTITAKKMAVAVCQCFCTCENNGPPADILSLNKKRNVFEMFCPQCQNPLTRCQGRRTETAP